MIVPLPLGDNGSSYNEQVIVPLADFMQLKGRGYEGFEYFADAACGFLGIQQEVVVREANEWLSEIRRTMGERRRRVPVCPQCGGRLELFGMAGVIQQFGEDQLAIIGECRGETTEDACDCTVRDGCGASVIIRTYENGD
jgi:hypothetical protein